MTKPLTLDDLIEIKQRYLLARDAGIGAIDAGDGWDDADAKVRALMTSWQDVATLHDELRRRIRSNDLQEAIDILTDEQNRRLRS